MERGRSIGHHKGIKHSTLLCFISDHVNWISGLGVCSLVFVCRVGLCLKLKRDFMISLDINYQMQTSSSIELAL